MTRVVGTQKNRLIENVLLNSQYTCINAVTTCTQVVNDHWHQQTQIH